MRCNAPGFLALLAASFAAPASAALYEHPEGSSCATSTVNLVNLSGVDVGAVRTDNDEDTFSVEVAGESGWRILGLSVFAGAGAPPAQPLLFPHQSLHLAAGSVRVDVPLASLNVGCGDDVNFAVAALLVKISWKGMQLAIARNAGYPGASTAICCEGGTCLQTAAEYAASGDLPASEDGEVLCWSEATGVITHEQAIAGGGSVWADLAREHVATWNNQLCVAFDCVTGPAMVDSQAILGDCVVDESETAEALELTALFVSFNDGSYDVGDACF